MIDPVTVEVLRARLDGIVREMQQALFRTGYSTAVRESHDASCALLDEDGQVVAQHTVLPLHLGAFPACTQGLLRRYPPAELSPGDVFVINHPYEGGSPHALDVAVLTPVLFRGALAGFAGSIAHKPDIGGSVPGSGSGKAREIFEEGLHLPAVRWTPEVECIFAANSRTPELVTGDVRGQIGATRLGERRLLTLLESSGTGTFKAAAQALADRTQRAVRRAVSAWPDGVYRAEGQIDDDGITIGRPVTIRLTVEIAGDRIRFDWSESDPQTRGPANIRPPLVRAVCYYCLKALIDPELPVNRGLAEAVEATFRSGTLLDPVPPAPVSSYMATAQICAEVVLRALGPVAGARRIAESGGTGGIVLGWANGRVQYELFGSALGARAGRDGVNAVTAHVGNSRATPVEILESEFPVRLRRVELLTDSGGAGRWRGGLGAVREYELLDHARLSARMDRHSTSPRGLDGGCPGRPGALIVNPGTPEERRLPARSGDVEVRAGDILRLERPGGGGMGDPAQRDPAAIAADLLDGYLSVEAAARDYGYRPGRSENATPGRDRVGRDRAGRDRQRHGGARRGGRVIRLRYGQVQRSAMNWPYYVARDGGGFAAAGIEITEAIYPATRDAVSALLAGQLDLAHVIPDGELPTPLRAVARVLDRATYRLFGRPGRVGVSALDSGDGPLVRLLLRHLGVHGDLVPANGPESRVAALLAGRIDATMVTEPFTLALEDAGVPLLGDLRQALPDFPFALCVVRGGGPSGLETYLEVLRQARERLRDPAAAGVLATATGCSPATAERVRLLYLRDGHLGRFDP